MVTKTPTGVAFFDAAYGGTYQGRVMLVSGKSGTGKSILALQFLAQGLKRNERCLLLSARPAEDVALHASAFGISVDAAIDSHNLVILEYSEYVPGRDREDQLTLPPDSFLQLKQIVEEQAIQRVVLDTALPWVAVGDLNSLPEHIFSFVRVFHRMGTTSLFTLPKPVSTAAFKLRKLLEDVVPVSITLSPEENGNAFRWHVNKYLGSETGAEGVPYVIRPRIGLLAPEARAPEPVEKPRSPASEAQETYREPPRYTPPIDSPAAPPPARPSFVTPDPQPPPPMAEPPRRQERPPAKPKFSDLLSADPRSNYSSR